MSFIFEQERHFLYSWPTCFTHIHVHAHTLTLYRIACHNRSLLFSLSTVWLPHHTSVSRSFPIILRYSWRYLLECSRIVDASKSAAVLLFTTNGLYTFLAYSQLLPGQYFTNYHGVAKVSWPVCREHSRNVMRIAKLLEKLFPLPLREAYSFSILQYLDSVTLNDVGTLSLRRYYT